MARVGAPARQFCHASIEEGEPRMPIFHEAGSLFFYISCVSWFPNRCFVVMTVLPFSCAFVCIRGSKTAFCVFRAFRGS